MKLIKGKKLVVYFGFMRVEEQEENGVFLDELEEEEEFDKKRLQERTELIEGLNKNVDAHDVSDLYVRCPDWIDFNPILFRIHIPLSLQKTRYVHSEKYRAPVEDFFVVYDGSLVLVYVLCDLGKLPFGVLDARDHLKSILNEFGNVKTVPPTISFDHMSYIIEGDEGSESFTIPVPKQVNVKDLIQELYDEIYFDIYDFYEATELVQGVVDENDKIEQCSARLLGNLRELLGLSWWHLFKKYKVVNQMKKEMAEILERLADYKSYEILLNRAKKDIKRNFQLEKTLFLKYLHSVDWWFFLDPYSCLDIDSTIKSVEHVRSEIETFSLNTSTIFSALIGAITGSVITLIISNLI